MPQLIEFEGQRHEFPDDFTQADIQRALSSRSRAPRPIQVQGPDGAIVEFPAGTSNEEMTRALQKHYGGPQAIPPLPIGYKLDTPAAVPPLPQGYKVDRAVTDPALIAKLEGTAPPAAPGAASPPTPTAPGAQPAVQPTPAPNVDMSQAKQAPDGNFYVPDPSRPGKFLQVQP